MANAQEWFDKRKADLRNREKININTEIKSENAKNKYKLEGPLDINGLVKVKIFDCSDNGIVKMELSKCTNLQKLILINNPIRGSLEFLKNSSRLSELDISNTDIDDGLELLPESLKKIICKDDKKKDRKILEQLKDYCTDTAKGIYDLEKWREDNRKSIEDAKKKMNEKQKLISLKNNDVDLLLQAYYKIEKILQDYFQEKINATQLVGKAIEKLKELESSKAQLEQVSRSQDELKDSKEKEIENLQASLASIKKERDNVEKNLQDYFQEELNATQLVEKAIEKLKELESLKVQLEQVSKSQDELKDSKKKEIENLEDSLVRTEKERDELKKKIVFFDPIHQDFYNIEKLLQDYFQEKLNTTKLVGKAIEKLKELESSKVQLERNSKLQDELKDSKEKEIKNLEVSLASVKKERDNIEKILQDYFQEKLNATQLVEKAIEKLELFKVQLEQVSKSQDELKDSKENLEDSLARTEKERYYPWSLDRSPQ